MQKPYLQHEQQVELLGSRGLDVSDDQSVWTLRREGYFSLINGYKKPFQIGEAGESFQSGANLAHLVTLFEFDRSLRMNILEALAQCEATVREATVRSFCATFTGMADYLSDECYSDGTDQSIPESEIVPYRHEVHGFIRNTLAPIGDMNRRPDKRRRSDYAPLAHYRDRHESVPLWVAVQALTFGDVVRLYEYQRLEVRTAIAVDLREQFAAAHGVGSNAFEPRNILLELGALRRLRNACAHDERIYCLTVPLRGHPRTLPQLLGILSHYVDSQVLARLNGRITGELDALAAVIPSSAYDQVRSHVRYGT